MDIKFYKLLPNILKNNIESKPTTPTTPTGPSTPTTPTGPSRPKIPPRPTRPVPLTETIREKLFGEQEFNNAPP